MYDLLVMALESTGRKITSGFVNTKSLSDSRGCESSFKALFTREKRRFDKKWKTNAI